MTGKANLGLYTKDEPSFNDYVLKSYIGDQPASGFGSMKTKS